MRTGTVQVKVTDDAGNSKTANITVRALDLTINPSTAVVGETITLSGGGFESREPIDTVIVGGIEIDLTAEEEDALTNGNFTIAIQVPSPEDEDALGSGERLIRVISKGNRESAGTLTVPEAAITLTLL